MPRTAPFTLAALIACLRRGIGLGADSFEVLVRMGPFDAPGVTVSASRARALVAVLALAASAACSESPGGPEDAGDERVDTGIDASIVETDSGPPPPPWMPAFPARRVFFDPAVTCEALPPYVYAPPPRSTTPGDLEWVIDPVRSPSWVGFIPARDSTRFEICSS